ncbi:hypothetical protein OsI_21846 [Oryza sativa Indica Group]|uniref:Uncharacterized protein n=1 Tax=Oryza sativa subsp. indica TaxID=39946 RepID=A2Y9U5_ORYSI|nr:hypothetical protein OsI_21846 [Oryza sativa Indica Group]
MGGRKKPGSKKMPTPAVMRIRSPPPDPHRRARAAPRRCIPPSASDSESSASSPTTSPAAAAAALPGIAQAQHEFFAKHKVYHYGAPPLLNETSSGRAREDARACAAEFAANQLTALPLRRGEDISAASSSRRQESVAERAGRWMLLDSSAIGFSTPATAAWPVPEWTHQPAGNTLEYGPWNPPTMTAPSAPGAPELSGEPPAPPPSSRPLSPPPPPPGVIPPPPGVIPAPPPAWWTEHHHHPAASMPPRGP